VDALAPSNFLMTNPQVLRETIATGGENLVRGMNNLLRDLERGGGQLRVSMTDETAFQLGRKRRHEPGQGDLPERPGAAHPVPADHERGVPPAARDHPALDQQVLHPRPAEKNSSSAGRGAGHTVFVMSW